MKLLELGEQVLSYVYLVEQDKRIAFHLRGLVENGPIEISVPFGEIFVLRPRRVVEVYTVYVARYVLHGGILMEQQAAVRLHGLVADAVYRYAELGYVSAVLQIHWIFLVDYAPEHAYQLLDFVFVARQRTGTPYPNLCLYILNHLGRAFGEAGMGLVAYQDVRRRYFLHVIGKGLSVRYDYPRGSYAVFALLPLRHAAAEFRY